jgi:hypothetical protein
MTIELALTVVIGVAVAFARSAADWWRCRAPLALVNHELARARERRRRRP